MGEKFNKPDFPLFDNHTFVFCGDGCLEEGMNENVLMKCVSTHLYAPVHARTYASLEFPLGTENKWTGRKRPGA